MTRPSKPLKWYHGLSGNKARSRAGAFLIEGDKALRQVIIQRPEAVIEILAAIEPPPVYSAFPARRLTESQFKYISSTRAPQGIAAVVKIPEDVYSDALPLDTGRRVLLLEDIQDPGNAGTLIRTAAAFGFSGVILTPGGADPFSPKCVQAAAGTLLSVWLRRTDSYLELVKKLQEKGFTMAAANLNGDAGPEVLEGQDSLILALGNEAAGLSQKLLDIADYQIRVPVDREKAESLNVAICGAILMYLGARNI